MVNMDTYNKLRKAALDEVYNDDHGITMNVSDYEQEIALLRRELKVKKNKTTEARLKRLEDTLKTFKPQWVKYSAFKRFLKYTDKLYHKDYRLDRLKERFFTWTIIILALFAVILTITRMFLMMFK